MNDVLNQNNPLNMDKCSTAAENKKPDFDPVSMHINISCDMCMDLIPLVRDAIASEDSKSAVLKHIESCEACRILYCEESPAPVPDGKKAAGRLFSRFRTAAVMLLMFGILFGVSLTAAPGVMVFYNFFVMPLLGATGYIIFKWKAAYIVPILIGCSYLLISIFGFTDVNTDYIFFDALIWTTIYSLLSLAGAAISGLLHFAFKKD